MRLSRVTIPHSSFRLSPCWFTLMLLAVALAAYPAIGAGDKSKKSKEDDEKKEPKTIGDVASVEGLQSSPVEGVGLVVGLDDTGSDPTQGADRTNLLTEMQKRGIKGSEDILRSSKTALVRIRARIPPAVRSCKSAGCWCKSEPKSKRSENDELQHRPHKGDTFDIEVEVPNRDTTKSLQGGWLLEAWLTETAALRGASALGGHVRGRASGPILVSSGFDGQAANPADLRRGRILGGGLANDNRDFALITESDRTARWTMQIANRINERFPGRTREGKSIAEAKTGQQVTLKVPPRYRQNVARYLEVLRYMPLTQSASQEADRMQRYEENLMNPVTTRTAAVKLEGIGIRAAESLKKGLNSSNPDVRFFAAEALAYLDEPACAEVLAKSAREIPEYRAHALTALSSLDEPISRIKLEDLLGESDSIELRYGAFQALRALDPEDPAIPCEMVGDQMRIFRVTAPGKPAIVVSSRERAEVVLFGRDLRLQPPLFLNAGGSIMLMASDQASQLKISRFEADQPTRELMSGLELDTVIQRTVNMGATFPDIVGILVQAEKNHNLPGRLEMDAIPDPTRILARLQRISESSGKAADNVAMPNLYHWLEPKKGGPQGASKGDDEVADSDSDESGKDRKYISKPSFLDRLFGRTAN